LRRKAMLRAVRAGMNIRQAGQQFGFPKSTVAFWVQRTYGERLDRIDLANRKPGRASNRTAFDVEQRIAQLRIDLCGSVLGDWSRLYRYLRRPWHVVPPLRLVSRRS
jgi:transposase